MSVVAKSETKAELTLQTGDFWPDINVGDFRVKGRVPTIVDDRAALYFLERAFIVFLDDVADYEEKQKARGYMQLKDVPAPKVGDRTRQEILFESAIFAYAKKLICDDYKDIDLARKAGQDKTKEIEGSEIAWNAEYLKSIRQFLGKSQSFVSLI